MSQPIIPLPPQTLQMLKNIEALDTPVLETFLEEVNLILARRKAPSFSLQETELMLKINHGVPRTIRKRQKELSLKNRYETITKKEHQELIRLGILIEQSDLIRLNSLIELAEIQHTTVDKLMDKLGLKQYA